MSWAARLAALSEANQPSTDVVVSADSHQKSPIDNNDATDIGDKSENQPFAPDPIERAAIEAEALPVRRLRLRAAGWGTPRRGDHCGCCKGSLWWAEAEAPKGWRCCCCHPPAHLEAGKFRVIAT